MHMASLSTSHSWQLLCTGQVEPKIVSFTEAEGILEQSFDEQLAHAPVWYVLVTLSWRTWGVQGIFSLYCLEQGLSLSYEIRVPPKSMANKLRPSWLDAKQRRIRARRMPVKSRWRGCREYSWALLVILLGEGISVRLLFCAVLLSRKERVNSIWRLNWDNFFFCALIEERNKRVKTEQKCIFFFVDTVTVHSGWLILAAEDWSW